MDRKTLRSEIRAAKRKWLLEPDALKELKRLLGRHRLSVVGGHLQRLDGRWYVTHAGLVDAAKRRRCSGIETTVESALSDPVAQRWIFKATVYMSSKSKSYVAYGDADPSNVSAMVRGAEMRIAETRALNRALRRACAITLCSVEELGSAAQASNDRRSSCVSQAPALNGYAAVQPRLRDQLCLLIRQFQLDPALVKRYAASYCGACSISAASRESVEAFISHLKKSAEEDRGALNCKLNSFAPVAVEP